MIDLKFETTRDISRSYQEVPSAISNEKIREVTGLFVQNMNRVLAVSAFPLGAFNHQWMLLRDAKALPTLQRAKGVLPGWTVPGGPGFLPPTDAQRFSDVVEVLVQRGLIETREQVDEGIRAILGAMITGAWTAFEVLAGVLWEASVNEYPESILDSLAKPEMENGQQVQRLRLPLSIDEFKNSGYNLQGQLGTLIRRDPKSGIGFDRFERIADSYRKAFSQTFFPLDSHEDRSLLSLAQVRNAIVHRAGRAISHS